MQILANKSMAFIEVTGLNNETEKLPVIGRTLTVIQKPGLQDVPDWIRDTDTFKNARKDGSVVETNVAAGMDQVMQPPTVEEVMRSRNCPEAEASRIVAIEIAKFNQGEYPYPPKVAPAAAPTVESLRAAGLTKEQAERALQPAAEEVAESGKSKRNKAA